MNTTNTTETKKNWTKPELELISKDAIKSGLDTNYPEGAPTPSSLYTGAGS